MENLFNGEKCPVCNARFFDDEDIVFCPECGTPHHRECWKALGHCSNADKHAESFNWIPEKVQPENNNSEQNPDTQEPKASQIPQFPRGPMGIPFTNVDPNRTANPYMPFGVNYGGVDPDDNIDGVSVKDTASFIRIKTERYIPVFKKLSGSSAKKVTPEKQEEVPKKAVKTRKSWNWAAFIIPEYWFAYRKCYLASVFSLIINAAAFMLFYPFLMKFDEIYRAAVADTTITYNSSLDVIRQHISEFSKSSLIFLATGVAIFLLLRVFCAFLGDYIYKNHVVDSIKKTKKTISESRFSSYEEAAAHIGGVNILSPVIMYFIFQLVMDILISLSF